MKFSSSNLVLTQYNLVLAKSNLTCKQNNLINYFIILIYQHIKILLGTIFKHGLELMTLVWKIHIITWSYTIWCAYLVSPIHNANNYEVSYCTHGHRYILVLYNASRTESSISLVSTCEIPRMLLGPQFRLQQLQFLQQPPYMIYIILTLFLCSSTSDSIKFLHCRWSMYVCVYLITQKEYEWNLV